MKATATTLCMKLLLALKWSSIMAVPVAILEYYSGVFLENKTFLIIFFSSFVADIILGVWKHLKLRTFDFSLLMWGALTKLLASFLAMILFNGLAGAEGIGETGIKIYILLVGKLLVLLYVDGSAFVNMSIITKGKFPPKSWLSKIKGFNETLDTTVFTAGSNHLPTSKNLQNEQVN